MTTVDSSMPDRVRAGDGRSGRLASLVLVFVLASLVWAVVAAVGAGWSLQRPWIGVAWLPVQAPVGWRVSAVWPDGPAMGVLEEGDLVTGIGSVDGDVTMFEKVDLLLDPDLLPRFASLADFLARQDRLASALAGPEVRFVLADGRRVVVRPLPERPIGALSARFWVFQFYGAIALFVGAWVWATAGARRPASLLWSSGACFSVVAATASLIATRGIALPGAEWRLLLAVYHLANNLFSLLFLALLWQYPARLGGRALYGLFAVWVAYAWSNEIFRWHDLPGHNVGFQVFLFGVAGLGAITAQWIRSRGRPADRAVVRFLLLSVMSLNTLAIVLYYHSAWWLGDETGFPLVVALGMVVGIYLAMVVGVLRYRLFELDRWWARLWLWLVVGAAILAMDVFVGLLAPDLSPYSLPIVLFFVAWIYFPFRQWLWEKVFPVTTVAALTGQIPGLVLRLATERRPDPDGSWRQALDDLFRPLEVVCSVRGRGRPCLLDAGERLYVPGIRSGGFELCLAQRGTRLFGRGDLEMVKAMHEIVIRLDGQLEAYRRGLARERERIMRDLHDDVGGRLLTLVHECEGRRVARISREALDALREVIHFSTDPDALVELPDVTGRWRRQIKERLEQGRVDLDWDWDWDDDALEDCALPAMTVLDIGRILQEAVSNALRHARPRTIGVQGRLRDGVLRITIVNDGLCRQRDGAAFGGRGLHNMKRRAEEAGGELSIGIEGGHYRVGLSIPVPEASGR